MTINTVIFISIIVIVLITIIYLILFIGYIRRKNKILRAMEKDAIDSIVEIRNKTPALALDTRVSVTEDILGLIDSMISTELINIKRFEIILNKPSKNLDYEEVIKIVSDKVFHAIEPDVLTSPDIILTSSYLLDYIQKRTSIEYLTYIKNNASAPL